MCSIGEDDFGDTGGKHTMVAEPQIHPLNEYRWMKFVSDAVNEML